MKKKLEDWVDISNKVIRAVRAGAKSRALTSNEQAEIAWHEDRIRRFLLRLSTGA